MLRAPRKKALGGPPPMWVGVRDNPSGVGAERREPARRRRKVSRSHATAALRLPMTRSARREGEEAALGGSAPKGLWFCPSRVCDDQL